VVFVKALVSIFNVGVGNYEAVKRDLPLDNYVASKRDLLVRIAEPETCDLSKWWPILWQLKGGWDDDVDWPSRVAQLSEKTPQWLDVFKDLGPKLLEAYRTSKSRRRA
jgi:hypothetical protein